jgi:hypothetical protein
MAIHASIQVRRGTLRAFDSGTYKATVQIDGSLAVWLESVTVARNLPSAEMVPGRSVAVLFWDEANASDAVVVAVWV